MKQNFFLYFNQLHENPLLNLRDTEGNLSTFPILFENGKKIAEKYTRILHSTSNIRTRNKQLSRLVQETKELT